MLEIQKIWEKYARGEASRKEQKRLLDAVEKYRFGDPNFLWMEEIWKGTENTRIAEKVDDRLFSDIIYQIRNQQESYRSKTVSMWISAVASIILLVGLLFVIQQYYTSGMVTFEVPEGGKSMAFNMPDGSTVTLNAQSSITFPKKFKANRKVTLTGEAYFEVVKNERSQFTVNFHENQLMVTGTKFNINSHRSQNEVMVTEGNVEVRSQHGLVRLVKGTFLRIDDKGNHVEQRNISQGVLWLDGGLNFIDTKMYDVFAELERKYNVHIEQNADVGEKILTAKYPKETSLKEILEGLKYLQGIDYQYLKKDSILISN